MSVYFRKRWFAGLAVTVAVAASLYAQSGKITSSTTPVKIGYSIDSLKIERWQTDLDEFQKRAKELGAQVIAQNADGDEETQVLQAQSLINSGIKVLVLIPHNTETASRIVSAAKAKNVKVVSYDRLIRNTSDIDVYVGFDNYAIGVLQASALVQRAPTGNYVLIEGSPTDANAKLYRDGQMSVLQPLIDSGNIKIVAESWTADWAPAEAYMHTTEALESAKNDVAAIVAANDGTAGGAIQALEEHKLAGKVCVSGQDADLASIVRILQDTQTMTVYKPISLLAKRAAEAAVSLANGEQIATSRSLSNGTVEVPSILLSSVAVTKENVKETVVKDGFQKAELIKQGLPKEKWGLLD
jgi:D-xylose transport system substrate-binding protein